MCNPEYLILLQLRSIVNTVSLHENYSNGYVFIIDTRRVKT